MTHDEFYSVTSVLHHLMFDPPAAPETSILTVFPTTNFFFFASEYFLSFQQLIYFFASEYFLILSFQGPKLRMD